MGFMAGFWGSKSTREQDENRAWKQLWQVDEQIAQAAKQQELDQQQREIDNKLRERQFREGQSQFDAQHQLALRTADLEERKWDHDKLISDFDFVDEHWDQLPFQQRAQYYSALSNQLGDSTDETVLIRLAGFSARLYDEDWTPQRARIMLGTAGDANAPRIDVALMDRAADVLAESDDPRDKSLAEQWVKENREKYVNLQEISYDVAVRGMIAEAQQAEADVLKTTSEVTNLDLDADGKVIQNEFNAKVLDDRVREVRAGADMAEIQAADEATRSEFLRETIKLQIEQARVDLEKTKNENWLFMEMAPLELERLANDVGISSSELRVALATEEMKIRGADLSNQQLQAIIDNVIQETANGRDLNERGKMEFIQGLIESGNVELLQHLGDDFFSGIAGDDPEDIAEAREDLNERASRNYELLTAEDLSRIAMNQSSAEVNFANAKDIPIRREQEWVQLGINQQDANTRASQVYEQARSNRANEAISRQRVAVDEAQMLINREQLEINWQNADSTARNAAASYLNAVTGSMTEDRLNRKQEWDMNALANAATGNGDMTSTDAIKFAGEHTRYTPSWGAEQVDLIAGYQNAIMLIKDIRATDDPEAVRNLSHSLTGVLGELGLNVQEELGSPLSFDPESLGVLEEFIENKSQAVVSSTASAVAEHFNLANRASVDGVDLIETSGLLYGSTGDSVWDSAAEQVVGAAFNLTPAGMLMSAYGEDEVFAAVMQTISHSAAGYEISDFRDEQVVRELWDDITSRMGGTPEDAAAYLSIVTGGIDGGFPGMLIEAVEAHDRASAAARTVMQNFPGAEGLDLSTRSGMNRAYEEVSRLGKSLDNTLEIGLAANRGVTLGQTLADGTQTRGVIHDERQLAGAAQSLTDFAEAIGVEGGVAGLVNMGLAVSIPVEYPGPNYGDPPRRAEIYQLNVAAAEKLLEPDRILYQTALERLDALGAFHGLAR